MTTKNHFKSNVASNAIELVKFSVSMF